MPHLGSDVFECVRDFAVSAERTAGGRRGLLQDVVDSEKTGLRGSPDGVNIAGAAFEFCDFKIVRSSYLL